MVEMRVSYVILLQEITQKRFQLISKKVLKHKKPKS